MTAEQSIPRIGMASSYDTPPEATPVQDLISALLDSGSYITRVPDVAFRGWTSVHEFAKNYQAHAGVAPPVDLVVRKFPSFRYHPGLDVTWATHEVMFAERERELIKVIAAAGLAVKEGAHGEAVGLMAAASKVVKGDDIPGTSMLDTSWMDEEATGSVCPVPPGRLAELTGGHRSGQLWLIAALWGVGKSWKLIEHAVCAAEAGWDVAFHSLEMSNPALINRLQRVALRGMPIAAMSRPERDDALVEWSAECGHVSVFGPHRGRVDSAAVAASVKNDHTLVCVDYIGRMWTNSGTRAGEDHTAQALVSNELQDVALQMGVPVLAAAQLNRLGQVAGSIQLERDCDVLVHMAKVSDKVASLRENRLMKHRDGVDSGRWYTHFDPANGRFTDVSGEQAARIRLDEENAFL